MVFTADKCGPGVFNFPLWTVFTSPLYCAGLMLPQLKVGFRFTVIDMEHAGADRVIELEAPEQHIELAILLRDENRFGVRAIHSRKYPEQHVVSVSTDRLHTIAGEYKGKDDPAAIVRTQGIFPAPEEVVSPYCTAPFVAGDARGSHHMPLMPAPINTAITSASEAVDVFANPVWDATRAKAQQKADEMRRQGFVGAAMLPIQELEYGALRKSLAELEERFRIVEKP
jgi:fructose 1,6-bisphosphate aldolase/phosphatase